MDDNQNSQDVQITTVATETYNQLGTQYGVASIPAHAHNGVDTPQLPITSIVGYFPQVTAVPTLSPTILSQSIALHTDKAEIDYYDVNNHAWKSVGATAPVVTALAPSGGGTATLNLSLGNLFNVLFPGGNITLAISNGTVGQVFTIQLKQDSGGSRTVSWFSGISWSNNVVPTLSTTGNHWDRFVFVVTTVGSAYDGMVAGQNFQ